MISISLILVRLDKVEREMWNVHIVEHLYSAIKKSFFYDWNLRPLNEISQNTRKTNPTKFQLSVVLNSAKFIEGSRLMLLRLEGQSIGKVLFTECRISIVLDDKVLNMCSYRTVLCGYICRIAYSICFVTRWKTQSNCRMRWNLSQLKNFFFLFS